MVRETTYYFIIVERICIMTKNDTNDAICERRNCKCNYTWYRCHFKHPCLNYIDYSCFKAWYRICCICIYGLWCKHVLLYLFSTLLHSIHHPRVEKLFTILDHSAIYLLIAGTYTPFYLLRFVDH